jgi:hypothetical protein
MASMPVICAMRAVNSTAPSAKPTRMPCEIAKDRQQKGGEQHGGIATRRRDQRMPDQY